MSFIDVPRYPELSVDKIWSFIKGMDKFSRHFPNYSSNQLPHRDYMWNVLYTVDPETVADLIRDARSQRSIANDTPYEELVEIDQDYYDILKGLKIQKVVNRSMIKYRPIKAKLPTCSKRKPNSPDQERELEKYQLTTQSSKEVSYKQE